MAKLEVISVQNELVKRRVSIFSLIDFERIFKVSANTARSFLSYQTKKGLFARLKQGAYILANNPPTSFEIANYLWKPSYISFETALSYHGIIPETVYSVTSASTRPPKEFRFQDMSYQFYQIKKKLFFGYKPVKIRDKVVLLADPEKALLDYLYLASLKSRPLNERLDLTKIDKTRLGRYVNFFRKAIRKNKALISLLQGI
jgi:predicted transcriptional regulator of viral defense system